MSSPTTARRTFKRAERRRRRGGDGRGPVSVQRLARGVVDTADTAVHTARGVGAAALAGDRPYWVALLVLLTAGALMLAAPFQNFVDGRERVEILHAKSAALDAEIADLEQRRQDLLDPATIELKAREDLGLIMPGEVPYAVVPPPDHVRGEAERPRIAPSTEEPEVTDPWYRRWWGTLTGWLD